MPTLELFGFSSEQADAAVARARELLGDLPYREDIVFVTGRETRVIAWDGSNQPFIRVLTREPERAEQLRARLNADWDVETVLIGFSPRGSVTGFAESPE